MNFTATELSRLMQCNGSRLLQKTSLENFNSDMTIRNEGIAVHYMIDAGLRKEFSPLELVDRKSPNGIFITKEMADNVDWYFENLPSLNGFYSEIETNWQVNETIQINGRSDYIFHDLNVNRLHVVDFKYGWKIVEPIRNWTLISHAIAFIEKSGDIPNEICFSVYQPRPYHPMGNIRNWIISYDQLCEFSIDISETLLNLSDQLETGKECSSCPSLAWCPAATKAALNAIDVSENAFNDDIENNSLSYMIDLLQSAEKAIKNKLKAFEELAAHRLKKGQIIPNFSLKTSLSNRQWKDFVTPEILKAFTGKDLTKQDLVTPAQAQKLSVGKDVIENLSERVPAGFKLEKVDVSLKAQLLFNKKESE